MNGLLIIDKPAGITSHDVVARVRRILKTRRVGHTGTLDPFATGVMVLLIGQATRLAQFLDKDKKEYDAVIRFGFETNTGDLTGTRNAESGMRNEDISARIASVDWDQILANFRGEIEQTPPMFSAKKVDGKKLYEHARKGNVIERKPVRVTIHQIEKLGSEISNLGSEIRIRVLCSAGTYIRALAEDIGRRVGMLAHLSELRRIRSGKFTVEQSCTLDELERLDDPASAVIPINEAVAHLPTMLLPEDRVERTKSGLATRIAESDLGDGEPVRMQDANGNLIAIGFYNQEEQSVQPKVVLV